MCNNPDEGVIRQNAAMLALAAELEAVRTEVCGMRAENQHRIDTEQSQAYGEVAFVEAAGELRNIADRLRGEI